MTSSSEKAPRFSGIGGHHSQKAGTVEWLTPPSIIAALGPFDLDPCAPIVQPYPTATRVFTARDNGLAMAWGKDRIWLNPPYSNGVIEKWLARMAEHGRGTSLIFARTETEAFQRYVFGAASALLFMAGRINFHLPDGTRAKGNAGAPTVLCAYGANDADILAGCEIAGQFVPLRIPRSVVVSIFSASNEDEKSVATWRELIEGYLEDYDGPMRLDDIYRLALAHPKAAGNRNVEAKVRQELQRGAGVRVAPGLWEKRA